jgi:hypothetical protein
VDICGQSCFVFLLFHFWQETTTTTVFLLNSFLGLCFACSVVHLLTRQQVASEVSVFGSILFFHVESLMCFVVTGEKIWKFCASFSLSLSQIYFLIIFLCAWNDFLCTVVEEPARGQRNKWTRTSGLKL